MTTRERNPRTILVVDDDEGIRDVLRDILAAEGYAVVCAENGQHALELLETIPLPSMIVLDLSMPVMTGRELLHLLRQDPRFATIPVTVISSVSDFSGLGDEGVLRKPLDVPRLLEMIESSIARLPDA
jgi:chemotaxis family two-component system sensor histidine kinase/response regulator PixL